MLNNKTAKRFLDYGAIEYDGWNRDQGSSIMSLQLLRGKLASWFLPLYSIPGGSTKSGILINHNRLQNEINPAKTWYLTLRFPFIRKSGAPFLTKKEQIFTSYQKNIKFTQNGYFQVCRNITFSFLYEIFSCLYFLLKLTVIIVNQIIS